MLAARTHRVAEWVAGTPLVPPDLVERTMAMQESVLTPGRQTPEWLRRESEGIRKKLKELRGDLLAELHVRGAYGVSCFLMVALGAALGVLFRGGQMITAFALSVVPAMVVIVMLVMGKQIVRNPELPAALGVLVRR